jgi:argininosuccinate synthase
MSPRRPAGDGTAASRRVEKVVLAYSGGLDTSVILRWLIETYGCEVVAFCADLGQGEELDGVRERATATGARAVVVEDLREEFVRDFVFPILRANAVYEAGYLLGTSIARPLIAKRQIEIARAHGAPAVAHGATGKGNDQVRFELTYYALEPGIVVLAPWREWEFHGRSELIAYAERHHIPITVTREKPYSMDRNLLHVSYEGGVLEDPWQEPYADMFQTTVAPERAPDTPEYVEIDYEAGDPVAVNGDRLPPADLLARLNAIAGRHGVGRLDLVENRYVGMKSRGVYETPGGTVLQIAHRAVESLTLDREVLHLRDGLVPRYAEMVYYGYWFAPERRMLQAALDDAQRPVSGTARVKLYKGTAAVAGRRAARSLYDPTLATFEAGGIYDQHDAEGFIRLSALRLRIQALVAKGAATRE